MKFVLKKQIKKRAINQKDRNKFSLTIDLSGTEGLYKFLIDKAEEAGKAKGTLGREMIFHCCKDLGFDPEGLLGEDVTSPQNTTVHKTKKAKR